MAELESQRLLGQGDGPQIDPAAVNSRLDAPLDTEEVVGKPSLNALEYATFLVIGVSYLWPWNCFLAATAYFDSRFTGHEWIQANLSSSIMTVSTVTATVCTFVLAQLQRHANYRSRVYIGEVEIFAVFVIMALSCLFSVGSKALYFIFILLCVLVAAVGAAFAQNGSFAVVNTVGAVYTQAIMVGQAVAGVLPAFISFVSALASAGTVGATASAIYFLVASVVAGLAFVLFHVMPNKGREIEDPGSIGDIGEDPVNVNFRGEDGAGEHSETRARIEVPLSVLLNKLLAPSSAVFLTFAITLVYPVFANAVESNSGIRRDIYIPLVYLFWNVGDLVGRVLCGFPQLVVRLRTPLVTYAFARGLMVPLFFLFSEGLIRSDILYLLLQFTFGVTNGHLGSSGMMVAPDYVNDHEKEAAGGFMTLILSVGLAAGSIFSFLIVYLV